MAPLLPLTGARQKTFQLDIKPGSFIDGFVEGIVGMTLDQTKEIQGGFPSRLSASGFGR
jgi:trigger factor